MLTEKKLSTVIGHAAGNVTAQVYLLGRAGCVSIEAGVESISEHGRNLLDKNSRLTTAQITDRLVYARERVPFVLRFRDSGEVRVEAVVVRPGA